MCVLVDLCVWLGGGVGVGGEEGARSIHLSSRAMGALCFNSNLVSLAYIHTHIC